MINSNQRIFSKVIELATRSDRAIDHLSDVRWIATNDEEKKWLQNLSLTHVRILSHRARTACFSFENRQFFAAVGFAERTNPGSILVPAELNAGIFTALIDELDVGLRDSIDPLVIVNEVLPQFQGAENYAGHSFASVAEFFQPLALYEIDADSPIKPDDLGRLSCFWILQNGERVVLPFSAKTREHIDEIIATGAESVPFGILLNCLQSAQWSHAFLEVYRCVERLFSFQVIEDLHKELALTISLPKFAERIETVIGWRPREEDAISRLFGLLPIDAQSLFEAVRDHVTGNPNQKIHNWVYELRNSVVHFRPATRQFVLSDSQWDQIIRGILLLIEKIYQTYDAPLRAA